MSFTSVQDLFNGRNSLGRCGYCNEVLPADAHKDIHGLTCGCDTRPAKVYPDGNPKTAQGAKKPPMWLNPFPALIHLATAFADGAVKYGPFNWRKSKVSASVYLSAVERHIGSWKDGEDFDPKSRVHHLAHAMACLAIILDAKECGALNDDRPAPAPTSELINRYAETGTLEKKNAPSVV